MDRVSSVETENRSASNGSNLVDNNQHGRHNDDNIPRESASAPPNVDLLQLATPPFDTVGASSGRVRSHQRLSHLGSLTQKLQSQRFG